MITPATLFTDGCVLPQGREIRIFGTADSSAALRGELKNAAGCVISSGGCTAKDGSFLLRLPPAPAQQGCTLTLCGGGEEITTRDVAIGEVYLAGGQSNMELALCNADGGPELVEGCDDPLLRWYNVPKLAREGEEMEKAVAETRWQRFTKGCGGDISAVACFFALKLREERQVPVGIIDCWWGGTSITCWLEEEELCAMASGRAYFEDYQSRAAGKAMETYLKEERRFFHDMDEWNRKSEEYRRIHPGCSFLQITEAVGVCPWNPPIGPGSPYRPCGLAQVMLRRVTPASLTGILYYQGEEDSGRHQVYTEWMTALIAAWRKRFMDAELPFLFVQLPMWIDDGAEDSFNWPAQRMAQDAAWKQNRSTGMAVIIDEGEYGNIHPTNKKPVGERLWEQAKIVVYHEPGQESPRAVQAWTEGGARVVRLTAAVTARGGLPLLMEVQGEDGAWHEAACDAEGCLLRLSAEEAPHPVAARYAWHDWAEVPFFGENGLPLAPFVM